MVVRQARLKTGTNRPAGLNALKIVVRAVLEGDLRGGPLVVEFHVRVPHPDITSGSVVVVAGGEQYCHLIVHVIHMAKKKNLKVHSYGETKLIIENEFRIGKS